MSEEDLSEEDRDAKRMEIVQALSELGENKLANELFKKLEEKITFAEREDWVYQQVCSLFPNKIDPRCLIWCCSPQNPCQFRAAVLRKLGLTLEDFIRIKAGLAEEIKKIIERK